MKQVTCSNVHCRPRAAKVCRALALSAVLLLASTGSLTAQLNITPLSTFGGDGWLAPGEGGYSYLTTGTTERGLAYGGNGHLYLVSRNGGNYVRILDAYTGGDLGALSLGSGVVTGGVNPVNTAAVGSDGAIYVANLTTAAPANGNFRVYRWGNELAAPTVAYSGAPLAGARVGDSLDAIGSGSSTRLAAGFAATPTVAGNNGYAVVDPTAGTATPVSFAGSPPAAGDFRLGITFTDASHVFGTQGAGVGSTPLVYSAFSGGTGSLLADASLALSPSQRLMDYAVVGGRPLLALLSTSDSTLRIYDVTDPADPLLLGSQNNTSGTLTANSAGTGAVAWGDITGDSARLWTLSTSQGIQAFIVTVPEPSTSALAACGAGLLLLLNAPRRRDS
jgi:hypothetical protein